MAAPSPALVDLPRVAVVFGASAPVEGDSEFEEAEHVGRVLAEYGFKLINGGYYGTMEATAKGAGLFLSSTLEGMEACIYSKCTWGYHRRHLLRPGLPSSR